MSYPFDMIAGYLLKTASDDQCRAKYGSNDIVAKLSSVVSEVILNCNVECVIRDAHTPQVVFRVGEGAPLIKEFDHVVLACEAFTALRLLKDPTQMDIEVLDSFAYEKSDVVVHTDVGLMPPKQDDWCPMNFYTSKSGDAAMFTMLFELEDSVLFETWNPVIEPDPRKVIKKITFARPVMGLESSGHLLGNVERIQGDGNVWFAGAYLVYAVPLQENGVVSAISVARKLGVRCPWVHDSDDLKIQNNIRTLYESRFPDRTPLFDGSKWVTFGLWDQNDEVLDIDRACGQLAELLGNQSRMFEGGDILDVGFGLGKEIAYWHERFGIQKIKGIDPVKEHVQSARKSLSAFESLDVTLLEGVATNLPFGDLEFDKVVGIDCAYHFQTREAFFKEAFRVLRPNGSLAMVDFIFSLDRCGRLKSTMEFLLTNGLCVPKENFCSLAEFKGQLLQAGFMNISIIDISSNVFPGFNSYVTKTLVSHLRSMKFSEAFNVLKFKPISSLLHWLQSIGGIQVIVYNAEKRIHS